MRVPRPIRSLLLVAPAALLGAAPAHAAYETVPLPAGMPIGGGFGMHSMVVSPTGDVWFASSSGFDDHPGIAKYVPSTGTFARYPTPVDPRGAGTWNSVTSLAWEGTGGAQRLWFARNDGLYGVARPAELVDGSANTGFEVATTTPAGGPRLSIEGLAVGPNGTVWMAQRGAYNAANPPGFYPGNRLASTGTGLGLNNLPNLAQQGGEQTLVSLRYSASPMGPSVDAAGDVWFGESDAGNPGWRLARARGASYTEWSLPCVPLPRSYCSGSSASSGGPDSTAIAPDGKVWFTIPLNAAFGSFDPRTETMTTYRLADVSAGLGGATPRGIRTAPDGSLWFATTGGGTRNAVVKVDAAGATPSATVFPTVDQPLAVAPAPNGDLWIELATGKLGRLTVAGSTPTPTPGAGSTPTPGATPTPAAADGPAPAAPSTPTPAPAAVPTPTPVALAGASTRVEAGTWKATPDGVQSKQLCVGPPNDRCSLIYLLDTNEYVAGFPGTRNARAAAAAPKGKRRTELGRLRLTLKTGQSKTVTVKLSAKAKRALKTQRRLKVRLTVTQVLPSGAKRVLETRSFTLKG
ncbi:MAG: hypothetical protein PGN13_00355 [Patulibacter minatonensis]